VSAQAQGQLFEDTFHELLGRLVVEDLGWDLEANVQQGSGSQFGKDIQARWREPGGAAASWHFECKSHVGATLGGKEVADKILDVARSSHRIQVWCLVTAHAEPSTWIDETFAWAADELQLPFILTAITPQRHFIKDLYRLHPDLYERQYGESPSLDSDLPRDEINASLRRFLSETTQQARDARLARQGSWEIVGDSLLASGADPRIEKAYFRGLLAAPPWSVITEGRAVPRESAVHRLTESVVNADVGLEYLWLVGAGGEGKSTVLRQLAWEVAQQHTEWTVLFSDPADREGPVALPLRLIDGLEAGAKVLLCIDESQDFTGGRALKARLASYIAKDLTVFVVVADRGLAWRRSGLRRDLQRGMTRQRRDIALAPLSSDEMDALVGKLAKEGLLHAYTEPEARSLATAAASSSHSGSPRYWLLPLLLQLTDPGGRGFESILLDVLMGLQGAEEDGALSLLLAASIGQAAGGVIPRRIAERLLGGETELDKAASALIAELESEFATDGSLLLATRTTAPLLTHHRVIAETLVDVAFDATDLEPVLRAVCRDLPQTAAPDLTDEDLVPRELFAFFAQCGEYLWKRRPPLFPCAAELLESWAALDPRLFPGMHQLAECHASWTRDVLKARKPDERLAADLIALARAEYRRTYEMTEATLADGQQRPRPYARYKLDYQRRVAWHAWAVFEGVVGAHFRDRTALERSALLSMLAFQPGDRHWEISGSATLALTLLNLDEPKLAAMVSSAYREVGRQRDRANLEVQRRRVEAAGCTIPAGGRALLPEAFAAVLRTVISSAVDQLAIFPTIREHRYFLRRSLESMRSSIGSTDSLDSLIVELA
jgi:hypothetical protein